MKWLTLITVVSIFLIPTSAFSEVQYSYEGNQFDFFVPPYSDLNSVQGHFLVSSELGPNFPFSTPELLSYTFSDGVQTLTQANSNIRELRVSTDGVGNILQVVYTH